MESLTRIFQGSHLHHLIGEMILSKPALQAGFAHQSGKQNVGVHEFTHMVKKESSEYGLPPEVPLMVVRQWVRYLLWELRGHRRITPKSAPMPIRTNMNYSRCWLSISSRHPSC